MAFDIIGIGASSGGVQALQVLVNTLASDFDAAVLIVLHLDPHHRSQLAAVLGRHAPLRVTEAIDGQPVRPGTIVTAPPDCHLRVDDSHIVLTHAPRVHYTRPSVDSLLESIAATYRERAIGVVLTGSGSDGADGIRAIKAHGGTTIIQDPAGAEHPSMPEHAWATGCVDLKLPLEEIGPMLVRLVGASHAAS